MAKRHTLKLSKTDRHKLINLCDRGEPAYVRELTAALLKIHEGCVNRFCIFIGYVMTGKPSKDKVKKFMTQFRSGSQTLLQYVGFLPT